MKRYKMMSQFFNLKISTITWCSVIGVATFFETPTWSLCHSDLLNLLFIHYPLSIFIQYKRSHKIPPFTWVPYLANEKQVPCVPTQRKYSKRSFECSHLHFPYFPSGFKSRSCKMYGSSTWLRLLLYQLQDTLNVTHHTSIS